MQGIPFCAVNISLKTENTVEGSTYLLKGVFKQSLSGDRDLHMAWESIRLSQERTKGIRGGLGNWKDKWIKWKKVRINEETRTWHK